VAAREKSPIITFFNHQRNKNKRKELVKKGDARTPIHSKESLAIGESDTTKEKKRIQKTGEGGRTALAYLENSRNSNTNKRHNYLESGGRAASSRIVRLRSGGNEEHEQGKITEKKRRSQRKRSLEETLLTKKISKRGRFSNRS